MKRGTSRLFKDSFGHRSNSSRKSIRSRISGKSSIRLNVNKDDTLARGDNLDLLKLNNSNNNNDSLSPTRRRVNSAKKRQMEVKLRAYY